MKALILAAGKGTRMKELTVNTPKPLLKAADKPILEHILNKLKKIGIKDIVIVVGYLKEQIIDYFGNGNNFGVNISYINQIEQNGTGAAVLLGEKELKTDTFIMLNGDVWIETEDYLNFKNTAENLSPDILIAMFKVDDPFYGGAIYLDNDFNIIDIIEKPSKGTAATNYINAGMYVFTPKIFNYLKLIKPSVRNEYELPDAINLMLNEKKHLIKGYEMKHSWLDIGNKETLDLLNERL
jgi:UDP-N-acetylglucosamine diphosphorylase / glucose-1-phosphate thymidylyltransferase / UDP-N-acetylgalactosamine diphosphorylase / glucosamine-1-phosphate N-acetyltransferase / galactosamine-1-phosphate N-acetyltransferase